jgi:tRNA1(Val) A37 N6-methylase TrmN6
MDGPDHTTSDEFLGGALRVLQPKRGFRAGLDSVLLAAAARAPDNGRVFDLGMGVGVASLCLLRRRSDVSVEGLEIDDALCILARANAAQNAMAPRMRVHQGDALRVPAHIPRHAFDAVMTNPPFLHVAGATTGPDESKARAIALDAQDEADWFRSALSLLKPKGTLTMIHRADALGRILSYLTPGTGAVAVLPLHPAEGKAAVRVIVWAVKGSRAPMTLLPGLALHGLDGRFTPPIERILREGAALSTSAA